MNTTNVILTPETDHRFGMVGSFWLYSVGMKGNYDLPDLEMRGVPGMLTGAAHRAINEINAYRLISPKPIVIGETISWSCGEIVTEHGDDWDGRYEWNAEDMIRLTSRDDTVHGRGCFCDQCREQYAGLEE